MKSVQELHIGAESGAVKFEKRTPAAQSEGRVHTVQHVQVPQTLNPQPSTLNPKP